MPGWPRSWANLRLLELYSHRNAWANLHLLGQPDAFVAQAAHYLGLLQRPLEDGGLGLRSGPPRSG